MGKQHTEPITTDKQCHGDSPFFKQEQSWYCTAITRSCDYRPCPLLAMAPGRPRLLLQNPVPYHSDVLLLLLSPIITANRTPVLLTVLIF